jgi:hypothetical protein
MPSRFALAVLVAALSIAPAAAQIRASGAGTAGFGISAGSSGVGSPGMGRADVVGGLGRIHQGHRSGRRSTLLAYPYFYSDPDYDSGEASQQPQVVVVQASAPLPPPAPPAPRESLLIEWQGDHFVRTTSAKDSAGAQIATDYAEKFAGPSSPSVRSEPGQKNTAQPPRDLPPAVLVFRDGHSEEVQKYMIQGANLYATAAYSSTGSWTKKIPLADLDIPASLKTNKARGTKFNLPSGPNEVVIRF